jgi:hypothetical protein
MLIEETKILYPVNEFMPDLDFYYKNNFNNLNHKDQPMTIMPEKIKDLINNNL